MMEFAFRKAPNVDGFMVIQNGSFIGYVRKTGKPPSEKWTALQGNMTPLIGEYDSRKLAAKALAESFVVQ